MEDGPPEQAPVLGGAKLDFAAAAPGGLAEDGDVVRVAPESGDVPLHPGDARLLVQVAEVGGLVGGLGGELRVGQEAEHVDPVIDAYQDHAPAGDALPVHLHLGGIAHHEAAAVEPDHHRQLVLGAFRIGPDVQLEAVLAHGHAGIHMPFPGIDVVRVPAGDLLHGDGAELKAVAHPFPGHRGLGGPPAVGARGGGGEGDALEGGHSRVGGGDAPHPAALGFDFTQHYSSPFNPGRACRNSLCWRRARPAIRGRRDISSGCSSRPALCRIPAPSRRGEGSPPGRRWRRRRDAPPG